MWDVALPRWLISLIIMYLSIPFVVYYIVPYILVGSGSVKKRIIIYVLGDLGHSPRMCYHARSFSSKGFQVELCGYVDSTLPEFILRDDNITIHALRRIESSKNGTIGMIQKVLNQFLGIIRHLWELRGSNYILIQNPPSIPILPIVALYRIITGTKLIIDWHNLAYSILRLKYNGNTFHPLVIISIFIELIFSHIADYNLTVTNAMKNFLINKFWLNSKRCYILYDRPASQFRPFNTANEDIDKNNVETIMKKRNAAILSAPFLKNIIPEGFNLSRGDKIIVTSTSFTPDEDLGILLGALKIYENSFEKFDKTLPRILCLITGKGPLKAKIMKEVASFKGWNRVHIEFLWLSPEDYPKLLSLCDYGVSLHSSSSGLDLPMKILDMFGSGIPVIAFNYPTLDELVKHDINGLKFVDRRELHESLIFAMKDKSIAEILKQGAIKESRYRWQLSWENCMKEAKIIH